MGSLVSSSGISGDLYNTAYKWCGHTRGGLAVATSLACAAFAAVCGSSIAGAVTMGKISLPEMKKHKYNESLSTGVVAAGGTLGILIPPSMGFIMYGILTENSVGALFMAGVVPGILLTLLFVVVVLVWTTIDPKAGPPGPKISLKEKFLSLKGTWGMLALFIVVLGSLYMGICTPTESGAIGVLGAVIIALINRRLNWHVLVESVKETGMITAKIGTIVIGAYILMRFLAISQLPNTMATSVAGLHISAYLALAVILLFFVILGMFLEIMSAIIFTVPIVYPIVTALGFDPIWFGVIMVIIMEMGLITPPIGMNVFALGSVTDVSMVKIYKGALPFAVAMLVCIIILIIAPQIVMFLPNTMK
jgi:C4-dicarboxylate transporter, DctM subunit